MAEWEIVQGDCLDLLSQMADESVQCCITSPPYFGLRDYNIDGQLGLESTPEDYVIKMVEVFREVRRVLRDDGTVWLNLGDSYNSAASGQNGITGTLGGGKPCKGQGTTAGRRKLIPGLKPKDLIGIPWRVALALQADGWYLRQDIIWHKPNPMPEPVRDRCTKAHEYVFLLSKKPKYYYDHEAVKEKSVTQAIVSKLPKKTGSRKELRSDIESRHRSSVTGGQSLQASPDGKRNRRSVWTVSTKPFKGAHFAVFPPDLIEPCILAGCPRGGIVLDPFAGSGTVGVVSKKHGRSFLGLELNPEYCEMARKRIGCLSGK